ncbi:pseudouridine synthase [Streptosporangium saharense]|uniref:pseudouridine synthase n=1 Tax=Streptosporangium saharense TaxID=1706840 RepID=UPI0036B079D0
MNSRRSTPSGDGRGRGRGGAPHGGNFRGSGDSRGGSQGGFRSDPSRGASRGGPRGDDRGGFRADRGGARDDRGGFRAERGGSRGQYGRPEGGSRQESPRREGGDFRAERGGSRGRYGRPEGGFRSEEHGGFRGDAPRRDDRGGFRSDAPRRDDRGGFRNDGPRREERGGFRSEGPRRDDRGFRSGPSRPGERDGFRGDGPRREERGGFRSDGPRRDDRGGFRSDGPRREERGGFRSEAPRRDDRGGFRSEGPRRDERDGSRPERDGFRAERGGSRGRYGRPEGGSRDNRGTGGSRGRYGRNDRGAEVRTISGGRADSYGERRTGPARDASAKGQRGQQGQKPALRPGAIANDRFKTARQPKRDADFYDADYVDERDTTEVPGGVRLQKVLAQAGVASRRACEEMIGEGRVTVDGQVVRRFGARVDPAKQVIHVDGKRLPTMPDLVYLAINKPLGVVSTMSDPDGRPSLADYVADRTERLFHVGRLDTETEGLILLTNDGELANRLTHPSYGVQKKYWAKVPGRIERDLSRRLKKGVELEDGLAKADSFSIVQEHGQQALVEIVLHEGRKHIVRRMLEEVGHPVIDLARIEFGPVKLGRLKPGTVRALTLKEVGELYAAVGL